MTQNTTFVLNATATLSIAIMGTLMPVVALASGVITNHSGTICKNYSASDATQIGYLAYGTQNNNAEAANVICPLTRNTSSTKGAYVYVHVTHSSSATTTCTAYSYDTDGTLLASDTDAWTGTGFYEFILNLAGVAKSQAWSDYSVLCNIPGNAVGVIHSVDLLEQ